jgi:hypothetical protein
MPEIRANPEKRFAIALKRFKEDDPDFCLPSRSTTVDALPASFMKPPSATAGKTVDPYAEIALGRHRENLFTS